MHEEVMTYQEFRERYEEQHPASVPVYEVETSHYPAWLRYAVGLMYTCAATVSGAHTIPLVRQTIPPDVVLPVLDASLADVVAIAAFGFVELALLIAPFAILYGASWLTVSVLIIAVTAAMTSNIYSVITSLQADDIWMLFVALVIGIAAPGVAALSGKIFVNLHRSHRGLSQKAQERYREELKAWDTVINREYTKHQKQQSKQSKQALPGASDISQDFMKFHENSVKPKPRVKLHEVAREIHENGDENLSTDEMMAKYGISMGSTTKIREILNGHHSHST
jgi:hypothetical protein